MTATALALAASGSSPAKDRPINGRMPNVITGLQWSHVVVTSFAAGEPSLVETARQIETVVRGVLVRSGPYPVENSSPPDAPPAAFDEFPDFDFWAARHTDILLTGRVLTSPDGRMDVQYRLWDVHARSQWMGRQRLARVGRQADLALAVAADVFEAFTDARDAAAQRLGIP